jgi:hypothetical protein
MSKSAWAKALVALAALILLVPATASAKPPKTGSITQVGHEPLMNRGMNAIGKPPHLWRFGGPAGVSVGVSGGPVSTWNFPTASSRSIPVSPADFGAASRTFGKGV